MSDETVYRESRGRVMDRIMTLLAKEDWSYEELKTIDRVLFHLRWSPESDAAIIAVIEAVDKLVFGIDPALAQYDTDADALRRDD